MNIHLKSIGFAALAVGAALAVTAPKAQADIILTQANGTPAASVAESFVDLGAQGFGNAPRLLTLQTNGVESGGVTPVNVTNDDAVPGTNKSTTPTLATLGWSSGAAVGIGFNSDQEGQTGITMQTLVLTIYNGTTAVGTFHLAASETPLQFTAANLALQQGNGNAVFDFGLTASEQAQFNTILAMSGSSGFFAGLSSTLGCPAGAPASCQPSNDGPDSFIGFAQTQAHPVPEPSTLAIFGTMLIALGGIGYVMRRRRDEV